MILEERSSMIQTLITRNSRKDDWRGKIMKTGKLVRWLLQLFSPVTDHTLYPDSLRKGSANAVDRGRAVCFIKSFYKGFYFKD